MCSCASACLLFAQAERRRREVWNVVCQKEIFRVLFDAKQCRYTKYIFKRFGGSDLCDHWIVKRKITRLLARSRAPSHTIQTYTIYVNDTEFDSLRQTKIYSFSICFEACEGAGGSFERITTITATAAHSEGISISHWKQNRKSLSENSLERKVSVKSGKRNKLY